MSGTNRRELLVVRNNLRLKDCTGGCAKVWFDIKEYYIGCSLDVVSVQWYTTLDLS